MPKVKAHFKVHVSIINHGKTGGFWADPMLRGIYVELGRLSIERYADRTEDSFYLSAIELMAVTGASNPGAAVRRFQSLLNRAATDAESMPNRLGTDGEPTPNRPAIEGEPISNRWRITIPNLAKKQGFKSRKGVPKGATPTSAPTSTSDPTPKDPCGPDEPRESGAPDQAGSKDPPLELLPDDPPSKPDPIDLAWTESQEVFAGYGRKFRELGPPRRRMLSGLLAEFEHRPRAHLEAIHGYRYVSRSRDPAKLLEYTRPETVWAAGNRGKYLDAYDLAIEQGLSPPFMPEAESRPGKLDEMATELAKQEAQDAEELEQVGANHRLDSGTGAEAHSARRLVDDLSRRFAGTQDR